MPLPREPDDIRRDCAKLAEVEVSPHFRAILGCLHGVAEVAELDGDEIGFLVGRAASPKRIE